MASSMDQLSNTMKMKIDKINEFQDRSMEITQQREN
jgi:hypothetical protein